MCGVETLRYATPATVSRCGMIWFSEDVITLPMVFSNYLETLRNVPMDGDAEDELPSRRADGDENAVSPNLLTQRAIAAILAPNLTDDDGLVAKTLKHAET